MSLSKSQSHTTYLNQIAHAILSETNESQRISMANCFAREVLSEYDGINQIYFDFKYTHEVYAGSEVHQNLDNYVPFVGKSRHGGLDLDAQRIAAFYVFTQNGTALTLRDIIDSLSAVCSLEDVDKAILITNAQDVKPLEQFLLHLKFELQVVTFEELALSNINWANLYEEISKQAINSNHPRRTISSTHKGSVTNSGSTTETSAKGYVGTGWVDVTSVDETDEDETEIDEADEDVDAEKLINGYEADDEFDDEDLIDGDEGIDEEDADDIDDDDDVDNDSSNEDDVEEGLGDKDNATNNDDQSVNSSTEDKFNLASTYRTDLFDDKKIQHIIDECMQGLQTTDRGQLVMPRVDARYKVCMKFTESFIPFIYKDYIARIENMIAKGSAPEVAAYHADISFPYSPVPYGIVLFLTSGSDQIEHAVKGFMQSYQGKTPAVFSIGRRVPDGIGANGPYTVSRATKAVDLASAINQRLATPYNPQNSEHGPCIIFGTYHAIQTVSKAQQEYQLPAIDLMIIDEAHRTSDVIESERKVNRIRNRYRYNQNFINSIDPNTDVQSEVYQREKADLKVEGTSFLNFVHDNNLVKASHRLYLTSTPNVWFERKKNPKDLSSQLYYSTQKLTDFGPVLSRTSFSDGVKLGLTRDYRVLVVEIPQDTVEFYTADNQLNADVFAEQCALFIATNKLGFKSSSIGARSSVNSVLFNVTQFEVNEDEVTDNSYYVDENMGLNVAIPNFNNAYHYEHLYAIAAGFDDVCVENFDKLKSYYMVKGTFWAHSRDIVKTAKINNAQALADAKASIPANSCGVFWNTTAMRDLPLNEVFDGVLISGRNFILDTFLSLNYALNHAQSGDIGYIIVPIVSSRTLDKCSAATLEREFKKLWNVTTSIRSIDPERSIFNEDGTDLCDRFEIMSLEAYETEDELEHDHIKLKNVMMRNEESEQTLREYIVEHLKNGLYE